MGIKRIYISGPITGTTDAKERFSQAALWLAEHGFAPINPAELDACGLDAANFSHAEYMALCRELLSHVDGIYMLTDWQGSMGAREELCQVLERYPEYDIILQE